MESSSPDNHILESAEGFEAQWYAKARAILAQELRTYRFGSELKDEDLTPEFDLPLEHQSDRGRAVFGFSIGHGLRKQTFVIRFDKNFRGEPQFELKPVVDPSERIQRVLGNLTMLDQGRTQIEKIVTGLPMTPKNLRN